ncbi:carbohydrate kinase [Schizosaccharomyces cryophilus OY26]|uniref:Carbohydrate kinase n=1 Tax=Schizosaccharomyces cryophilus (strain OY26 / ATCC MYA-4695 / CBS 11777 / NBRC 106824 / NRRL Y48691) TaxID=653667 RepID=S9W8D6_SCHCR|nr:carbohydrate kinase [Schizosaccharomyces cryophilus OY26]EPY54070.1 carbohydrate kinase [Schizosaccharomyces cryophilus OY26]
MSASENEVEFVTSGMFIIDEIEFDGGKKIRDIIGGGGSFALVGARIWSSTAESKRLRLIVDKGSDFPESVKTELDGLDAGIVYRETPERKTTYGYNRVHDNGLRLFEYLSPKKPIRAQDLVETGSMESKTIHVITSPKNFISMSEEIAKYGSLTDRPKVIWEPTPESCCPENWPVCQKAMKYCDIFSPNEVDTANLLAVDIKEAKERAEQFAYALQEMQIGSNGQGWAVLRCGSAGCFIAPSTSRTAPHQDEVLAQRDVIHLPSVPMAPNSVLDTTGAGNTFCGALILEYHRTGNIVLSSVKATVAASFAIQQHGLPKLTKTENGIDLWNGESAFQRLKAYYEYLQNHDIESVRQVTKHGF